MADPALSPLAAIRLNLYRTLRGTTAARGDPGMTALSLEVGILDAIAALDAILSPEPAKGGPRRRGVVARDRP